MIKAKFNIELELENDTIIDELKEKIFDLFKNTDFLYIRKKLTIEVQQSKENIKTTVEFKNTISKNAKIIIGEVPIDQVFPFLEEKEKEFTINNMTYKVKLDNPRLILFRSNPNCVCCGIKGTKLMLEFQHKNAHFNLYGENEEGMILMTKDHIKPRSRGGKNALENYQTMCQICNSLKENHNFTLEQMQELRIFYDKNKLKCSAAEIVRLFSSKIKKTVLE